MAVLSVRFEVGVSLLLVPAGADKGAFSSRRKYRNTAGNSRKSTRLSPGRSRVLLHCHGQLHAHALTCTFLHVLKCIHVHLSTHSM